MVLILNVPGASPEQIARGLEAAHAVLDAAGVTLATGGRRPIGIPTLDVGWRATQGAYR
jgi:hypothetical protein